MNIHIDDYEIIKMLPMFFCGILVLFVILCIAYILIKKNDDKKPLITKKVKVLEKPVNQGNIAWYVVECENGERLKLRSFQNNNLIIAVGDSGILSYRGQTIQSFERYV